MSPLDAYISRYGNFCAHDDDDNDTSDYFTPCACVRGNKDGTPRNKDLGLSTYTSATKLIFD